MIFFFCAVCYRSEQVTDHFTESINFDSVIASIINYFFHQIPLSLRRSIKLSGSSNFLFDFYLGQIQPLSYHTMNKTYRNHLSAQI